MKRKRRLKLKKPREKPKKVKRKKMTHLRRLMKNFKKKLR